MIEQRTTEWHAQRAGRITGSRVASVLGVSPWRTPEQLLRQMVREAHGAPREDEETVPMTWGAMNEPQALAQLEDCLGMPIQPCGFFEYGDHLGASPDGIAADGCVVEVKCPYHKRGATSPDEFKSIHEMPHYWHQCQLEMLATDSRACYFFQWAPMACKLEIVERDPLWLDNYGTQIFDFMRALEARIASPDRDLQPLTATIDGAAEAERYRKACAMLDAAKAEHDAAREALIALAGDNDKAEIGGYKLTRVNKAGAISYAAVVKELLPKDTDLEPYRGKPSTSWMIKDA